MFDWVHNGEGLTVFDLQGLGDPNDAAFRPTGTTLCWVLPQRRSRCTKLRPAAQNHPQPV